MHRWILEPKGTDYKTGRILYQEIDPWKFRKREVRFSESGKARRGAWTRIETLELDLRHWFLFSSARRAILRP